MRAFQLILPKFLAVLAVVFTLVFVLSAVAEAGSPTYVRGYFKSNGTYVAPHYRTTPDNSFHNNWSTTPNINPHTGTTGTRQYPSYGYGSTRTYSQTYSSPYTQTYTYKPYTSPYTSTYTYGR